MGMLNYSVALATYNGEMFLEKQMQSIINQTIKPKEIVVSDDSSTDKTLEIIKKYKINYPEINWILRQNKKNLGYSKNFRKAISKCSEEIIIFCDQDDIWVKNKAEKMLDVFVKNKQIKSLITGFKMIDKKGNAINKYTVNDNMFLPKDFSEKNDLIEVPLQEILGHNWSPGCTQAIRKDIVCHYMNIKSNMVHDWLFNIIASVYNGCYYLNETLTFYRIHKKNTIGIPKTNHNKTSNLKSLLLSFKYSFLNANPQKCKNISTNLSIETLGIIQNGVSDIPNSSQLEIKEYYNFVMQRNTSLQDKHIMEYIKIRKKYKKQFKAQMIYSIDEYYSKLMHDISAIIKK